MAREQVVKLLQVSQMESRCSRYHVATTKIGDLQAEVDGGVGKARTGIKMFFQMAEIVFISNHRSLPISQINAPGNEHREKENREARHWNVQKKVVDHQNVEGKATVDFAVNVQLVVDVGVAKRDYERQGIWHTAKGGEMIG
ncbi:unnamed protein product [Clavelina lepadiformis]|uniref:Uncharacterized protein n=1 Tax=Clavelina lepadiformis TaxID=159417 RepID=A0ABP0F030_CLALP